MDAPGLSLFLGDLRARQLIRCACPDIPACDMRARNIAGKSGNRCQWQLHASPSLTAARRDR